MRERAIAKVKGLHAINRRTSGCEDEEIPRRNDLARIGLLRAGKAHDFVGRQQRALRVVFGRHRMRQQRTQAAAGVVANRVPDGHRAAHLREQLGRRDVVRCRCDADCTVRNERLALAAPGRFELAKILRDEIQLEPISAPKPKRGRHNVECADLGDFFQHNQDARLA